MKVWSTLFLGLATAVISQAGIVSAISIGDFANPTILDFESLSTGAISGTDSYFTNAGISSVTAVGSDDSDSYDTRPNSSQALWFQGGSLVIVAPGTTGVANSVAYTINLASPAFLFGIGVHDQGGTYTLNFFQGVTNVGTTTFANNDADLSQAYFANTDLFDSVQISVNSGGGFAIDNLTLEATAAPEPGSIFLGGAGLALLALGKLRRSKQA